MEGTAPLSEDTVFSMPQNVILQPIHAYTLCPERAAVDDMEGTAPLSEDIVFSEFGHLRPRQTVSYHLVHSERSAIDDMKGIAPLSEDTVFSRSDPVDTFPP